jgi:acetoacetate decarboxylase
MPPTSPRGKASLVPGPPWHFSADALIVDFTADPVAVAEFMPAGVEQAGDGSASLVVGAWSSSADSDARLSDPSRGQYEEAYVVLYGRHEGHRVGVIAAIWVNSDLSIARGLTQGFAKKAGEVSLTRPVMTGRGGPLRDVGNTFRAVVSSQGRLLARAGVTLTTKSPTSARPPAGIATALYLHRFLPDLSGGPALVDDYVTNRLEDFQVGDVYRGTADLSFEASEFEDLDLLAPIAITAGWLVSLSYTLIGSRTLSGAEGTIP